MRQVSQQRYGNFPNQIIFSHQVFEQAIFTEGKKILRKQNTLYHARIRMSEKENFEILKHLRKILLEERTNTMLVQNTPDRSFPW